MQFSILKSSEKFELSKWYNNGVVCINYLSNLNFFIIFVIIIYYNNNSLFTFFLKKRTPEKRKGGAQIIYMVKIINYCQLKLLFKFNGIIF